VDVVSVHFGTTCDARSLYSQIMTFDVFNPAPIFWAVMVGVVLGPLYWLLRIEADNDVAVPARIARARR